MFPQKVPGKYNCQKCDYHSNKLSQWKRHLTTNKHKMLTDVYTKGSKPSIFTCDCGRSYSLRQSLSRHKQNLRRTQNATIGHETGMKPPWNRSGPHNGCDYHGTEITMVPKSPYETTMVPKSPWYP